MPNKIINSESYKNISLDDKLDRELDCWRKLFKWCFINFPNNPTVNQYSRQNDRVYRWNGYSWDLASDITTISLLLVGGGGAGGSGGSTTGIGGGGGGGRSADQFSGPGAAGGSGVFIISY